MALPSYSGLRGLNRVADARTSEKGFLSIGLFTFLGISPDERTAVISGETTNVTDTEYSGTGFFALGYGISDRFEIGANVSYLMNQLAREDEGSRLDITGDWEGDDGFSEAGLALKYTFNPNSESAWFGIKPWANFSVYQGGDNRYIYNGDGWDGIWHLDQPMFQLRRPMINSGSMSYGGDFLTSFNLKPLVLHANLGYHMFSQDFEFTDSRYDASGNVVATEEVDMTVDDPVLRIAGGIEYPAGTTTLFAEVEWRRFLDREFEDGNGKRFDDCIQIAPGARFDFNGFAMDITGSYCLSDFDPEFNDLGHRYFQAGQTLTEEERARYAPFPGGYFPEYGLGINLMYTADLNAHPSILNGTVSDEVTGEPLVAEISFPDSDADAVFSNTNGAYSAQLSSGEHSVLVTAEGYITESTTIAAGSGETVTRYFQLMPVAGTVTGTVTDAATGNPVQASISSSAGEVTTGNDGQYSMECPAGEITLLAKSDGYSNQSRTVMVPAGDTAVQNFELSLSLSFENVYFDYDRYNIRPDAQVILNQIADILKSNPGTTVMITGNTDSDGTAEYNQELAEERAMAVRNYLISRGVTEAALETVSYGEEKPAVPNNSEENKALNRRAEFIILSTPVR